MNIEQFLGRVAQFGKLPNMPRGRLTWRIQALFVVFALALLVPVVLLLIYLSFVAQQDAIARTQSEIAQRAALDISDSLSTIEQGLTVMAHTSNLADLAQDDQRRTLTRLVETLHTINELTYVDAGGHERIKVSPYHTFTSAELGSQLDSPGFREAMRGKRYLSDVMLSDYSGQPIVWLAIPISDLRQETVGVLIAQVNFREIWNTVTGMQVGRTGYAYVIDAEGRLIAYRDISLAMRHEDQSQLPTVAAFLQGHAATAEYRGLAGVPVLGAQTPIVATPWAVIVELPTDEAYANLYRMTWFLGALLVAAIIAAAATGRYLAGYIVRPIQVLQTGAATIGRGDLDHAINLRTGDEIQTLAEAFNTMARNLRTSQAEIERWNRQLEALVDERTAALQHANLQLQALARVSQSINAALALPDTLQAIAESSRAVLGAGRCAIFLLDAATNELRCAFAQGLSPTYLNVVVETYPKIPAAHVVETRQPEVIRDASRDPRLLPLHAVIRDEGFRSVALLPLAYGDENLGMLAFYHETEYEYTAHDLELAQTFANHAAIAIKNARMLDSIRTIAAVEERNRLAREIHDTLAQGLTGIVVQLEAAERIAMKQPARASSSLDRAKNLARHCLEEARRSLWNLRPTPLENLSLYEALSQAVVRINEQEGLQVELSLFGEEHRLPPNVELNLFRIAQEALTNVQRHARARNVTVLLGFDNTAVSLVVSDDGIGLDSTSHAERQAGLGLVGMRERAHLIGGDLTIESQAGQGTRITVKVPIIAMPEFVYAPYHRVAS
ncbi:MAG: GAF domain-containing protein [Chloroflexi bacterium]|nr:GAF domain-containing protein [Chloroflexota bacterium]